MGLEQLLAEELRDRLPLDQLYFSHRSVFINIEPAAPMEDGALTAIRTADDVYRYLGCCAGIDRTRPSLEKLLTYFRKQIIPALSADASTFLRITLSFVGKRNYSRYFVENQLNELIKEHTSFLPLSNELKAAKEAGELRLRCHIEDDMAFWGLGLEDTPLHRRPWRALRYDAQLHTPVAAAMARALDGTQANVIIDPFCGSGTILIESAQQYPHHQHFGFDVNQEAIDIARQAAEMADVSIEFSLQDSLAAGPPSRPYLLLSNPPWDEKHEIASEQKPGFIPQLAELIRTSAGGVLLLPEEMVEEIANESAFKLKRVAQTRVRGKLAWIIKW